MAVNLLLDVQLRGRRLGFPRICITVCSLCLMPRQGSKQARFLAAPIVECATRVRWVCMRTHPFDGLQR